MEPMTWQRGEYTISTDPTRLDREVVYGFIARSYWAPDRPREATDRATENSLNFGVYRGKRQVGLARVVSDYATYAYVADVFIDETERGNGLGTWLMEAVVAHPALQDLHRWTLFTRDAHDVYRKVGFTELRNPERAMERRSD